MHRWPPEISLMAAFDEGPARLRHGRGIAPRWSRSCAASSAARCAWPSLRPAAARKRSIWFRTRCSASCATTAPRRRRMAAACSGACSTAASTTGTAARRVRGRWSFRPGEATTPTTIRSPRAPDAREPGPLARLADGEASVALEMRAARIAAAPAPGVPAAHVGRARRRRRPRPRCAAAKAASRRIFRARWRTFAARWRQHR